MLNRTLFPSNASLNPVAILQPMLVDVAGLPAVPVMLDALLLLDLEAQETSVDLRAISQLVLGDLGATLQVLRLAGREYGNSPARPHRIEDCIADLGVHACLDAISAETVAHDDRHLNICEMWAHAAEIAQYCRQIADEIPGMNPEEAYMVGLLHSIGSLAAILGWDDNEIGAAHGTIDGLQMAKQWSLPRFVQEFFAELQFSGSRSWWSEVVRLAHQRSTRSSVACPFDHAYRPMLLRSL